MKLEDVEIGQQNVSNNWKLILKCYREVTAVAQLKTFICFFKELGGRLLLFRLAYTRMHAWSYA